MVRNDLGTKLPGYEMIGYRFAICEQHRRRSACASAHSDQCLCCSLPRYYNTRGKTTQGERKSGRNNSGANGIAVESTRIQVNVDTKRVPEVTKLVTK